MPRTQSRVRHERDAELPTMKRASSNRHDESSRPEARAGCGNSARPDLCGGRSVMTVPTATRSIHSPLLTTPSAFAISQAKEYNQTRKEGLR
jgi:hypothetical protein